MKMLNVRGKINIIMSLFSNNFFLSQNTKFENVHPVLVRRYLLREMLMYQKKIVCIYHTTQFDA